jgi:dipeptidyl aminopeptidase/acylaminoacyl peptidase
MKIRGSLMRLSMLAVCMAAGMAVASAVQAETPAETAAIFGARESLDSVSLSPDGSKVAYITPAAGQGSILVVRGVADTDKPNPILRLSGNERLGWCRWVAGDRLVCSVFAVQMLDAFKVRASRLFAIDIDGKNIRQLSTKENFHTRGLGLGSGYVVDWLPDEDGKVLMARIYLPDDQIGSRVGSTKEGVGVDRLDTRTLAVDRVEQPRPRVTDFISDGRGVVRIAGSYGVNGATGQVTGKTTYRYRLPNSRDWLELAEYDSQTRRGFSPEAVDHDLNLVYGFKKTDGRSALYSIALDGSLKESLIYARDDVDVDGLVRIGRRNRVVGVSYETDTRQMVYFDPQIKSIATSLSRAIPKQPAIRVLDSSVDERKLLIFAGGDTDPGVYYLFDRDKRDLHILDYSRAPLYGRTLATMKSVAYKAADGTTIPAYLTLPPGKEDAKGLPAIVMPHGGPSSRDSWGFDWLPQFYAARGYAVLQPQYRGSAGWGDAWYQNNGFQSWRSAIGDVVDAGRWLVAQGIADPKKLAIVGWSYGGYAALQSAVIAPDLYKAVVAIAPVTDLALLKTESDGWADDRLRERFIGTGPHIREGSPAQNADKIKVPVMLVHGTMDINVDYAQSTLMASRLKAAGGTVQLITFQGLDHQLEDSAARTKVLSESDTFLQAAINK